MKAQLTAKEIFTANDSDRIIKLITGAKIEFKTAENPDNLYGDDVYAAVFDEFTRAKEAAWFALRSTLTSTGGPCKFIGNVKGKKNWGHRLAMRAKAGDKDYGYFKITAYDAANAGMKTKDGRPFIEEIEDAKRDLPEGVFRELYLAEPSEDGSNPFGLSFIRRQIVPLSTEKVVCYGIDLAKSHDYTVIIGLNALGSVSHYQRFQKDWMQTKEIITAVVGNTKCLIDSTGVGDAIVEDLQRVCKGMEGFKFTSSSKQSLMEGLAHAIQNNKVFYPDNEIPNELEQFEFEYTRTGVRYSAPSGLHDDAVCALALAVKIKDSSIVWHSFA
jgi:phage FluMu gp28-like protein